MTKFISCRPGCAACCIAPSISSPIPGMEEGKPAGVPCPHLTEDLRCGLWGKPERPKVCSSFRATEAMCGGGRERALEFLRDLEERTAP